MPKAPADSLLGKVASYTEILARDPRSTVFVPLSETYRQMGLLDDALEVAAKGVVALPQFSSGYTALGRVQAQRGALQEAAAAFARALDLDRESLPALKGLARVRVLQGDQAGARELLQRTAALQPGDEGTRRMLASLAAPVPAPPPAAAAAPSAPPAGPARAPKGDPLATATIAEIYIRQGFPQRALKVYRDLLQADPHNAQIRQRLVALKRQLETQSAPVAAPAPAAEAEAPAPAATTAAASPESRQAEALSRWLTAIRQRREHVQ